MNLVDDLAAHGLGHGEKNDIPPVALWLERGIDMHDARPQTNEAGGKSQRTDDQAEQRARRTLRVTFASHLELQQAEAIR